MKLLTLGLAVVAAAILASALAAAAGDLDLSFGSGGKVTTDFGGSEMAWSVALQRDGKLVVAGDRFDPGPSDDFVLARYTPNGGLDPSFDGDGRVTTDFNDHFSGASSVAVQPDGKILAAGSGFAPTGPQDFALARYNRDGSLDQGFGAGGKVLTTFEPNSIDGGFALALQPDGKMLVGGLTRSGPTFDFALARYLPNGTLDPGFDGDGRVVTAITGDNDNIFDLAVQRDGKIVAAGWTMSSSRSDIALARYNQDGSLDPSFDGDGTVVASFAPFAASASDLSLQRDGKLLVAGGAVVRFNVDGSLDRGFGDGGRALPGSVAAVGVVLQPDDKILAIGALFTGPNSDFGVARLTTAGRLDATFGRNGSVVTEFSSGSGEQANDGVLQPDGKLVVAGMTSPTPDTGPWDFAVARYTAVLHCVVPNVRGKTLKVARSTLTKARCRVGTVKRAYSAKVKRGRVISQRPRARARLPERAKVNLVVSRGRKH